MATFANNLKAARANMELTQAELAEILQIQRSRIGAYEEGRATPSPATFVKMCEALGVDMAEMALGNLSEAKIPESKEEKTSVKALISRTLSLERKIKKAMQALQDAN